MKRNPCLLCGEVPFIFTDDDVHCYNDLKTHAIECRGPNAVALWNRLNPAPVTRQTIFALIRAKLRR
jgi:hypothetical protein